MTAEEWEPGDPIYRGRSGFGGYFYNFRDLGINERDPYDCRCGDRASWPEPAIWGHRIPEDPLARFIEEYHAWKAEQDG